VELAKHQMSTWQNMKWEKWTWQNTRAFCAGYFGKTCKDATQQLVGSSLKHEKTTTFLFPQFWEGEGAFGPFEGGELLCLWNMACLEFSFFCGNEVQCSQIEWRRSKIHAWCEYHLNWTLSIISKSSPPFPSSFWGFPLSLTLFFVFGVNFGHLMTKEKSSASL
jgi:hypothetical protein